MQVIQSLTLLCFCTSWVVWFSKDCTYIHTYICTYNHEITIKKMTGQWIDELIIHSKQMSAYELWKSVFPSKHYQAFKFQDTRENSWAAFYHPLDISLYLPQTSLLHITISQSTGHKNDILSRTWYCCSTHRFWVLYLQENSTWRVICLSREKRDSGMEEHTANNNKTSGSRNSMIDHQPP